MKETENEKEQRELFEKYGMFFAFSKKQFEEGVAKYKHLLKGGNWTDCGQGMYIPSCNFDIFDEEYTTLIKTQKEKELAEKGKKQIIWDALSNYECQIVCSIEDAIEPLKSYGITEDEINKEYPAYFQMCIDNDYF